MKVLFVYPDHMHGRYKPIGISLLTAILKEKDHTVEIFDSSDYKEAQPASDQGVENLMFKAYKLPSAAKVAIAGDLYEGFRQKVKDFNPDIIAVSVTYLLYNNGIKLIAALGNGRRIPVIFGGIHVTLNPEEVIANEYVDMICCGEGEEALVELLDKMSKRGDITDTANIWLKKDNKIIRNPLRPLRKSLDDLPFVDWSLYPDAHFYKPYMGIIYRSGDLIASRGCVNSCSYCFYHAYYKAYGTQNYVIYKSPKRTIEELRYVRDKYGVTLVKMRDADFTMFSEDKLGEMSEIYQKMGNDMPKILINANAYTITRKKVRLLKEMNCLSVTIGLESGSDYLKQTYLNRRKDNVPFLEAAKYFREYDIRLCSSNMIGIPHETRQNIFETVELNRKAKVDLADVSILFPFPGTQVHKYCIEKGFLKSELSEAQYYRSEPILDMPQIKKQELRGLIQTFQLYMNSPKLFYPLIKRAERDDALGRYLLKILKKIFSFYIFRVKQPYKQVAKFLINKLSPPLPSNQVIKHD
jgi:radical SAM superfamily enzyme YgiQ (UPF0313 family)